MIRLSRLFVLTQRTTTTRFFQLKIVTRSPYFVFSPTVQFKTQRGMSQLANERRFIYHSIARLTAVTMIEGKRRKATTSPYTERKI